MRSIRWVMTGACVLVAGVWLVAQQPSSEQAPPAFRTDVDIVRLEVSVLDNQRRPVRGLTAADFTIRENGRERPIAAFTSVELPPAATPTPVASWVRDAPRDVVSNAGADEGRLVVIAFDWSIRNYDQALARQIAHAAVDGLGPGDQAAVIFTDASAATGRPQNFTADRALLRAGIDQPFGTAMLAEPYAPGNDNRQMLMDPERRDSGDCHCGTCSLEALTRVASTLRGVSQRPKVVLFIGTYVRTYESAMGQRSTPVIPGVITPGAALQPSVCNAPLSFARETMERAMSEANATIHVLDPVGLETGGNSPLGSSRRIRERQDGLPVIADLTGGRTVMSTNEPDAHIPAIFDESGSYYLLGFTPDATAREGRSHRIEVRVRQRGVTVKARDRYTRMEEPVPAVETDAGLVRTIGGVLPTSDVPFEASAVPLIVGGGTGTATLVIGRLGGGSLEKAADVQKASMRPEGITLVSAAFTPRGAAAASKRVTLRPIGEGEPGTVLGLVSSLAIEPGPYEVRVAAELPNRTAGSVHTFVDVPDFRRAPLSMSGVLVHVVPEEPTAPLEELQGVVPFVPTARRTFDRTETVAAFVQISQGTSRTDAVQPVTVRVRVINVQDAVVRDQTLTLEPDEFATHRTATPRLALPVQNLPSGDYLLRIDAAMGERTAERAVRFEVE